MKIKSTTSLKKHFLFLQITITLKKKRGGGEIVDKNKTLFPAFLSSHVCLLPDDIYEAKG